MQYLELLELVARYLGFVVAILVLALVAVAYYRTRIPRLGIFALLSFLVATNLGLEILETTMIEDGVYLDLTYTLVTVGIAVVLLATVVFRFGWTQH